MTSLAMTFTRPDPDTLQFDEENHRAWAPDGRHVPRVTTIIREAGLSDDFLAVHPDVLDRARDIGIAVHAATHFADEGDLDRTTVDPTLIPYLDAWELCKQELDLEVVEHGMEVKLFSRRHWYCGRMDRIMRRRSTRSRVDRLVFLDLKRGDPIKAGSQYQTAAYLRAWMEMTPASQREKMVYERASVRLCPQETRPYQYLTHNSLDDIEVFLAARRVYWARHERGFSLTPF